MSTEEKEIVMKRKTGFTGILLTLMIAAMLVFTGCSSDPGTLEEYINNNAEAQEEIDALAESSGMEISVKGNTITYIYSYDQTFDEAMIEQMAAQFESTMESMSSTFEGVAVTLEEETGIEDITVKVLYQDSAETEIYSVEY